MTDLRKRAESMARVFPCSCWTLAAEHHGACNQSRIAALLLRFGAIVRREDADIVEDAKGEYRWVATASVAASLRALAAELEGGTNDAE